MPKHAFALEPGGPKRLTLEWKAFWKDFRVTLDGQQLGHLEKFDVKAGADFPLPDGTTLHVQQVKNLLGVELQVTRDGRALPGSASDPLQRIRNSAYFVYFIAAVNAALGVFFLAKDGELEERIGTAIASFFVAVVLGVLGFFTYRRSRVALILAMAFYTLDALYSVGTSGGRGAGGIIIRIFFLSMMARGLQAMGELKKQEAEDKQASLAPHP